MPSQSDRARVAAMLFTLMVNQNLTQSALAEKAGVPQSTVSALLNQKRSLGHTSQVRTHKTLRSLASALGQKPTYFERPNSAPTFGRTIRQARLTQLLSVAELAQKTAIPYSYLSLLERDRLPVSWMRAAWRRRARS